MYVLTLAQLDAWIEIVVECFSEWETHGGHRQKRCADTFEMNMKLAVEQSVGVSQVFVRWWEPEDLKGAIESPQEEARKEGWLGMK